MTNSAATGKVKSPRRGDADTVARSQQGGINQKRGRLYVNPDFAPPGTGGVKRSQLKKVTLDNSNASKTAPLSSTFASKCVINETARTHGGKLTARASSGQAMHGSSPFAEGSVVSQPKMRGETPALERNQKCGDPMAPSWMRTDLPLKWPLCPIIMRTFRPKFALMSDTKWMTELIAANDVRSRVRWNVRISAILGHRFRLVFGNTRKIAVAGLVTAKPETIDVFDGR
ncbi:hypothetical protein B0H16DRAFT_1698148 [Mycena metata]|uniref:Uncharacterized protein n=1 Tax=Mycena metata TaxID=1033252 RepID=A0AAD7HS98_9AGAR|nr:hypothetical protein B0H16DRAFT_1698148 [Mycena metata]